jgi:hypothetical protein
VFKPTGLADGAHTLTASENNTEGNTGSAALSFTLKTVALTPFGLALSPAAQGNATTAMSPVIVGSGEPSDTLTLFDQTGAQGTTVVGADGSWSVATAQLNDGSYSFYATEVDVAGNLSYPSAPLVMSVVPPSFAESGDYNGDGNADLLFRRQDGTLQVNNIVDDQVTTAGIAGQVGPEWHLEGIGDFNDDGTDDLLYRRGDGALLINQFVNNQVPVVAMLGQVGNELNLIGLGDFNDDGTTDILWQRNTDHMLIER